VTLADPEQIYQEVLQEEQKKGSAGPVAEGRAKAARVRAEHGSPHPKEPRWWPGAQPHLEGGDGQAPAAQAEPAAEPAPAEEPAPAPVAEAPVQPPAEEAPEPAVPTETAPAAAPAEAPAQAPAAEARAQAPAAAAPAQAPAAAQAAQPAPAPATPAEPAPVQRPTGVRHGTTTGTRLRPEDVVATEAQFAGERAMQERRKLIDELVASGVPAVTASGTGRPRAPYLSVLYLLIPLVVVAFLVGQQTSAPSAEAPADGATEAPADGGGGDAGEQPVSGTDITLVAESLAFNTEEIGFPPAEPVSMTLDNQDTVPHDFAIYPDEEAATARRGDIFTGEQVPAGSESTYEFESPEAGNYYFLCSIHPTMNGAVVVE
jgi:plastocyanin